MLLSARGAGPGGTVAWTRRGGTILLGRGGDALLRFGIFLATARVLSAPEFSLYALLTAALATSQAVFAFGAPRTAMFLHARGHRRPLFAWLVLLAAAAALLVALGLQALPSLRRLIFPEVPVRLVLLGLAPLPFLLLCDSFSAMLLSERRERLYTAFLWARTLGGAAVLAGSLLGGDRLVFLLAGRIVVHAAAAAGLFAALRAVPAWRGVTELAPEAVRYGLPVALGGATVALHRRGDVLLLSALGRTPEIGAYAVAYAMAETFWMVTDSLETALFAELTHHSDENAGDEAARALRLYRLAALGAFVFGLAAGEAAVAVFFRFRYPEAAVLLPVTLLAAVLFGTSRPCTSYLYSRGLGRLVLGSHAAGLFLNVALCLLFIPSWGARGAAAASLASYAAEVALMTWFFGRARRRAAPAAVPV